MKKREFLLLLVGVLFTMTATAQPTISRAKKINPTTVEISFSDNQRMLIDFYGENIFRLFQDNYGGILRPPVAQPEAQILVDNPRKPVRKLQLSQDTKTITINTEIVAMVINKNTNTFHVTDLRNNKTVINTLNPIEFTDKKVSLTLQNHPNEYFYGGGVQNGRFSHKGSTIAIENQNSWTDGGVASPNPFYWSSNGYGIMFYTFQPGKYDFGATNKNKVILSHQTNYLDMFCMIDNNPKALLNDFYQLTGQPVLIPKFGFYQGHLNAYNRDYWKENDKGILFEDGKRYKESQKENGGIKETLNGEKNNYQFSARAVIDRYKAHDMPLGWLLPNDGYGAGYGQTQTIDGNIENLASLTQYAHKKGVEIGLWTQSDLHPKNGVEALLQRDIVKEVRDAGVRILKTDVAWVGAGYSFGLNGVAEVAQIMPYYGDDARPFIISLDGWAGTQRYAGIWSGDQSGGEWEYIRFHIPTYLGAGLSGNPNITSDMDGIFGGKNIPVNIRDFQWKTFTPMQLNMDGWGANPKYPQALGEPSTSINRWYLKMKSELMPYAYTIAREAIDGLPMIRAMFLEYPSDFTHGTATQYQFLYGTNFLVAPIYQNTAADENGNDIRNGIYLPEGEWIDYFSGEVYQGNCILNNFNTPLWKIPVFVKAGAIIPMNNPHNNPKEVDKSLRIYDIYPQDRSEFTEYNDDGTTQNYLHRQATTTKIISEVDNKNRLTVTVQPTQGEFAELEKNKHTEFRINLTKRPKRISLKIGKKSTKLTEVDTPTAFENGENVYYYNEQPNLNRFATKGSAFEKIVVAHTPILMVKTEMTDIKTNRIVLQLKDFEFTPQNRRKTKTGTLSAPKNAKVTKKNSTAYTLTPTWEEVENADFYEIEFKGMCYTNIKNGQLLFEGLFPKTLYKFQLRAVNKSGASQWTNLTATTASNPLEFAIKGVKGVCSAQSQAGQGLDNLFDFDESSLWHSRWDTIALPFDIIIDLKTVNELDKMTYLPRKTGYNGNILSATVYYSSDNIKWKKSGTLQWKNDGNSKTFDFKEKPSARYIRIDVDNSFGKFGSGREMYIFKVPGTDSYLQGDINHDHKIDQNDLTSYLNYTGLRRGDSDFEGYVSKGDINQNNLIDAYDISVVATQLEAGGNSQTYDKIAGQIDLIPNKKRYKKGENIDLVVKGIGLNAVNALSFALPYSTADYEFVSVIPKATKTMENMTYNRRHTDGATVLYPTFVNIGEKQTISGDTTLFVIRLKAKHQLDFNLNAETIILVNRFLYWKQSR